METACPQAAGADPARRRQLSTARGRAASKGRARRATQSPRSIATRFHLGERMLMMTGRRQRIANFRNYLGAATLTFINPGIGRGCPRRIRGIETRVGNVTEVMGVFIMGH